MTTWNQGRPFIDGMLERGELARVPASAEQAQAILADAERHLASARAVLADDPAGAYALAYDAARKALAAVLENQGLRATSRGGHIAVYDAVRAQMDPPLGPIVRPFNRMRARRNEVEYPSSSAPEITTADVEEDLPKIRKILDLAAKVLPQMGPF